MYKIVHIHSDYKFLTESKLFDGNHFENKIIIQNKKRYDGNYGDSALFLSDNLFSLIKVINICRTADIIVLYDLTINKSLLTTFLPKNIIIIWRFFGYELYGKRRELFLSERTKQIDISSRPPRKNKLKVIFGRIYNLMKYGGDPDLIIDKAIRRIDYMLVLSAMEYGLLTNYWDYLPKFIQIPFELFNPGKSNLFPSSRPKNRKPMIIVGNNRNPYNNHVDIIDIIERSIQKNNYNFILLFNYGNNSGYANHIRELINGKEYYTSMDKFMSKNEYDHFFSGIDALVINSFRQMAMGNIFEALRKGVKVYLNEKNIYLQWLICEGFKVFTIDDFEKDIEINNFLLTDEIAKHNVVQINKLSQKYTIKEFQDKIYQILSS